MTIQCLKPSSQNKGWNCLERDKYFQWYPSFNPTSSNSHFLIIPQNALFSLSYIHFTNMLLSWIMNTYAKTKKGIKKIPAVSYITRSLRTHHKKHPCSSNLIKNNLYFLLLQLISQNRRNIEFFIWAQNKKDI